jgi:uncharacterized protein (TIGR02145 family)
MKKSNDMKKKIRLLASLLTVMALVVMLSNSCKKDEENKNTVADIDGNIYHTVSIGRQTWMVENLKTTKYRDGTSIPNVSDKVQWSNLTTGGYCNYDNNEINAITYGRLYNWYAVHDSHILAPTGWHVPTDVDWAILMTYYGGESYAGGELKEADTIHWQSPNTGATNADGFTALPGGFRYGYGGGFLQIKVIGGWWSSTEDNELNSWYWYVASNVRNAHRINNEKKDGYSVRCVKDK